MSFLKSHLNFLDWFWNVSEYRRARTQSWLCDACVWKQSHHNVGELRIQDEQHNVLWALQIREDYDSLTVMLEH